MARASTKLKSTPKVRDAAAAAFQRTRAAHASETAQDYAEAIATLREREGGVRVTDLARLLGVSHVTVVRTLDRLRRAGILEQASDAGKGVKGINAGIKLTPAGQRLARESRDRHITVAEFLRALGVPASVAEVDAEGIEHHVSAQTLAAFRAFLRKRLRC